MQALPFTLVGIGLGVFGGGLGGALSVRIMKKDPNMAKQIQIEENDERTITIDRKAKAGTYGFTSMLLAALIILLAVMQVQPLIIFVFIGAFFLRILMFIYLFNKYQKEM